MAAPLSEELIKKHSVKSVIIRKGDKVKVLRGQYKGKVGSVEDVQIKNRRVAIEGVNYTGRDGKKKSYLLHPSKVLIIELNLDDKFRKASIERVKQTARPAAKKIVDGKVESKTAEVKTEKVATKAKSTKGVKL